MRRLTVIAVVGLSMAGAAVAQQADLDVTKVASESVVGPGSTVIYTLTVENAGPDLATNVVLTDDLPSGSIFVSASPMCSYTAATHEVVCVFDGLPYWAAEEVLIEVVADVVPGDGEVVIVLTGDDPFAMAPATVLVATDSDDHVAFSVDDQLVNPRGIARESGGTLLIADLNDPSTSAGGTPTLDGRIIRIDRSTGTQTLLSSGGELANPTGIAVGDDGRIYVADPFGPNLPAQLGRVIEIDAANGSQTVLSEGGFLEHPVGIAALSSGDLAVADGIGRLLLVDPATGDQTLVSEFGLLVEPRAVAVLESDVVVIDGVSGLVGVDVATGAQTSILPIDWVVLRDPVDVEVDHQGHCWVADLRFDEIGAVLHIDPDDGSLVESFSDGDVWWFPYGIELIDVVTNHAQVVSDAGDPDPSNNTDWVATDIEEGYVPPIEVSVSETVTVTDGVLVDVITAVIIEVLETIAVSDAVATLPAILIDVSEAIVVSDTIVARPALTINLTEVINVSDAVVATPLLPVEIEVTESISVSDQVAVNPSALIAVVEQIVVTDTPLISVQAIVTIDVTENVVVSDQIGLAVETPLFIDGFESGDVSAWSATTGGP